MAGEWLLIINTFYNAILLTFASQLTQTKLFHLRKWLTAASSSLVGLLLFPSVISPIASFLLLLVAFPHAKGKNAIILLMGSFGIGGLLTALQAYASARSSMLMLWVLLTLLVLGYVVRFCRLRWQLAQIELIVPCEMTMFEQTFVLDGFIDTGNSCIEPISALPVHFVALPALEKYLPVKVKQAIQHEELADHAEHFRTIYVRTVHGERPLIAMQVDELVIKQQVYRGHYIVFIEKRPTFGRAVDVILHCSMLPNK